MHVYYIITLQKIYSQTPSTQLHNLYTQREQKQQNNKHQQMQIAQIIKLIQTQDCTWIIKNVRHIYLVLKSAVKRIQSSNNPINTDEMMKQKQLIMAIQRKKYQTQKFNSVYSAHNEKITYLIKILKSLINQDSRSPRKLYRPKSDYSPKQMQIYTISRQDRLMKDYLRNTENQRQIAQLIENTRNMNYNNQKCPNTKFLKNQTIQIIQIFYKIDISQFFNIFTQALTHIIKQDCQHYSHILQITVLYELDKRLVNSEALQDGNLVFNFDQELQKKLKQYNISLKDIIRNLNNLEVCQLAKILYP